MNDSVIITEEERANFIDPLEGNYTYRGKHAINVAVYLLNTLMDNELVQIELRQFAKKYILLLRTNKELHDRNNEEIILNIDKVIPELFSYSATLHDFEFTNYIQKAIFYNYTYKDI